LFAEDKMVRFSVDQLVAMMEKKAQIRNISVIAHVDHGKSTLTDSLVQMAGISTKDRFTDGLEEERRRGITMVSTGLSLYFEVDEDVEVEGERGCLLNLIDSPGHVDFSSEVTAALRLTDGALVVVDCVEGVCVQTETVLRQALSERVKPVLVINKLDRAILELQQTPEDCYQKLVKVIESVNAIISTYEGGELGSCQVAPDKGTVTFGSALHGWGFSLSAFARMLGKKLDRDPKKIQKKLWGDWFWDEEATKWTRSSESATGKKLKRGFCQFVLEPIFRMVKSSMANKKDLVFQRLQVVGVKLKSEEKELEGKALMKCVMPKWLPMGKALLEMMVVHLPSPAVAQQYRVRNLYEGPLDDECAQAIANCDPDGPLMVYISKMIPQGKRYTAYGRVFSGTVTAGMKVNILGPQYVPGEKGDFFPQKAIRRVAIGMGQYLQGVEKVSCGNTVCLDGVDKYLLKSGTLTTCDEASPFRVMKFSVSAVVRVAVRPEKPSDIVKLKDAVKSLAHTDPCVEVFVDEDTGEMIIAGAGELHIEVLLNKLRELCTAPFVVSDPVVPYCETVTQTSQTCLSKSANKHNRLFVTAEPLGDSLVSDIETGILSTDEKQRARYLVDEHGWGLNEGKKIWCFGPETKGPNVLVESTFGVQFMNEIKDSVVSSFQWVTGEGALCGEKCRGIRWNIVDCTLHSDSVHRGGGQLIPCARRVLLGSVLSAAPRLMEPIYLVEIQTNEASLGGVYSTLSQRRGQVISSELKELGTSVFVLKAYLPVGESFGFTAALRGATGGQAFPQCVFDHWKVIDSDPLVDDSPSSALVLSIRERKGLKLEVPSSSLFLDTL